MNRVNLFHDPVCQEHIAVITCIPVKNITYFPGFRKRIAFKTVINFDQEFKQNRQIIYSVFKGVWDTGTHLHIEHTQQPSHFQTEFFHGIDRICIAAAVMFLQNITVENLIEALHLLNAVPFPLAVFHLPPHIFKLQ